jgi:hypothetical protein
MYVFAYIAAAVMAFLGFALFLAPVRATRALHQWYIVPPAVQPEQTLQLAACRIVGIGLVGGGVALAVSITQVIFRLI